MTETFDLYTEAEDSDSDNNSNSSEEDLSETYNFESSSVLRRIPFVLELVDARSKTFQVSAVALKRAPIMMCYYKHFSIPLLLDTGAENNVISDVVCRKYGMKVLKTSSQAQQVDKSPLKSIGRVLVSLSNGFNSWTFDGLVCTGIGDIIIAGNPFLAQGINPVTYKNLIEIVSNDGSVNTIPWRPLPPAIPNNPKIFLIKVPNKVTIYPDEFIELDIPVAAKYLNSSEVLITPRQHSTVKMVNCVPSTQLVTSPKPNVTLLQDQDIPWQQFELVPFPPAQFSHIIGGKLRIRNTSPLPIILPRHQHIADIRQVSSDSGYSNQFDSSLYPRPKPSIPVCEVDKICLDPDNQLSCAEKKMFFEINEKYSKIFSSKPGKYNGVLGNLDAHLVLGKVEPPSFPCRRIIQSEKLDEIKQELMDQMEADGLIARPENVGIQLTHVHESYLIPKMDDGVATGEYRLVTNLQSLSPYIKPTRLPLPTIDDAFRRLGRWKFIILLDLRSWHWQIPVARSGMRFFGTSTPYGGDRVYTVQPQGYLNATENADRVIIRVLEPAIRANKCIRMADNMIVGGSTPAEAAKNYELLLKLCGGAGLTFKASKTVICPVKTNILGKVWKSGILTPSEHLLSTLANVTPPTTVKQMRSFLGGAKQMKDNLPNYSELFHPLEKVTAGRKSGEKIVWNEALRNSFDKVQKATANPENLALAKPGEKLFVYPDWSDENQSGGAPLYVRREGKWLKVRNFTQRLRAARKWSPCEGEAWMIRTAVENHGPWIAQSGVPCEVNTDNSACVLCFQRLRRGQFSRSVRVAFMLSTLAEFNVYIIHRAGANHPGDFDSRHPVQCTFGVKCQVCSFAHNLSGPTAQELAHPSLTKMPLDIASKKVKFDKIIGEVRSISVDDVLNGRVLLPFTQRSGWKNIQDEDKMLKTLKRHMLDGTIPQRRGIKQPELKKLYNLFQHQKLSISNDGIIVKIDTDNYGNTNQMIVVPNMIMRGIITALHIKFDHPHPSKLELRKVCDRYWFATQLNQIIQQVWDNCHQCQALEPVPREIFEQSTAESGSLGSTWSADVMRGDLQFLFIAREKLSSYTVTKIIENEKHETMREALITTTAEIISDKGLTVQVDNASSLSKLVGDAELGRHKIVLDLARKKNKDSNLVGEKAVKEFRQQKLKFKPEGGAISECERAIITASLNKKIRNRGVSAKEIIMNRDQHTLENLNLDNELLSSQQLSIRKENHPQSEKSKVKNGRPASHSAVWPGALVLLKKDISKLKGRELYIVVKIEEEHPEWCWIKKAVKQLRAENYKVKTNEIKLSPNQLNPTFDYTRTLDSEEESEEIDGEEQETLNNKNEETVEQAPSKEQPASSLPKKRFGLRNKPKPDYFSMHNGPKINNLRIYPPAPPELVLPPRYGWESESSSSDDEFSIPTPLPPVTRRFSDWCEQQPGYVPRLSIFLHWFKDKYQNIDVTAIETLAKDIVTEMHDKVSSQVKIPNGTKLDSEIEHVNWREEEGDEDEVFSEGEVIPMSEEPLAHAPEIPTARNSSTDASWFSILSSQPLRYIPPPEPPPVHHLPVPTSSLNQDPQDYQERLNSVISCPNNTCELSRVLPTTVLTAEISPLHYPILFNFTQEELQQVRVPPQQVEDDPHLVHGPPNQLDLVSDAEDLVQHDGRSPQEDEDQVHVPVDDEDQVDPPLQHDERERLPRHDRVDYHSLHSYGRGGPGAWQARD